MYYHLFCRGKHDWKPPPPPPIDYCYVRPQHIPSLNTLCREFFWPGIDCKYQKRNCKVAFLTQDHTQVFVLEVPLMLNEQYSRNYITIADNLLQIY